MADHNKHVDDGHPTKVDDSTDGIVHDRTLPLPSDHPDAGDQDVAMAPNAEPPADQPLAAPQIPDAHDEADSKPRKSSKGDDAKSSS